MGKGERVRRCGGGGREEREGQEKGERGGREGEMDGRGRVGGESVSAREEQRKERG